jgi:adenine-specific DNA methylase
VLSIAWDYAEVNPLSEVTGGYLGAVAWISKAVAHTCEATASAPAAKITLASATETAGEYDAIITDPPYYDAIPYSDLMDFFHVWLRRALFGFNAEYDKVFSSLTGPKWDNEAKDGELVDQPGRFEANQTVSRQTYEDGMARVFSASNKALTQDGVLVIVFANKQPAAWGSLVGALIRAGFVVDASWPIKTERAVRTNAIATASLSSSVWLVCRKRQALAKPGYDRPVLAAMRAKIKDQMRRFWDAGIRGPDFLWAATGPALEAYSQHPVVLREATTSGAKEAMPVAEFLREVRRLVVEFAVGRVLRPDGSESAAAGMDDVTTYYILHRETFGLADAPVGAAILYALSCGLSESDLSDRWEILAHGKGATTASDAEDDEAEDADGDEGEEDGDGGKGSGSTVRLRPWDARKRKTLGLEGIGGKPVPLIDRLHRLMALWKVADIAKVDAFLADTGLARDPLFVQVVQAVVELARRDGKTDETALLESISNHIQSRSGLAAARQPVLI